jgi:hypothetical protein
MTETHYHVLCVQDLGGSQEYWHGWDDKDTREKAEDRAQDAINADQAIGPGGTVANADDYEEFERKYRAKYGDDWDHLCSTNVNPGWEAIFIQPCDQTGDCDIWSGMKNRYSMIQWWPQGEQPSRQLPPEIPF